jgi:hypothetical protein
MARGHKTTREQQVAQKIIEFLADIRLDLDMVGLYLGRYARIVVYKRLEHIYETAKYHKEKEDDPKEHYDYIKNINY